MDGHAGGSSSGRALLIAIAASLAVLQIAPATGAPAPRPAAMGGERVIEPTADTGISVVRMPRPPALVQPQPAPAVIPPAPAPAPPLPAPSPPPIAAPAPTPPAPAQPTPAEPQGPAGRSIKVSLKLAPQPTDPQKGSIGAKLDIVDPPLTSVLGLGDSNGALVLEAAAGGPAARAGLRLGDVVTGLDGRPVASMNDFRQRIAASAAGSNADVEVWRLTADGGDFLGMLRRLAGAGNADMMVRLGRLYGSGAGVGRDEAEAVRWFQKGSAVGNVSASTAYAAALLEGKVVPPDTQEGLRLLRQAADKGHLEAIYRLGIVALEGKAVAKDTAEALRSFSKAADGGFAPAMLDLAVMYNAGEGVRADPVTAAAWYKKAADLGNSIGMVNLGFMYQQGRGVERNDIKAVALYRSAAAEGNSSGIHNLAAMLDSGNGVPRKDPEQAASLIMQALDLRNPFTVQQMTRNPRGWSVEFRRALQRKLRDAGVYSDKLDGETRPSMVEAINAYANRRR